MLRFWLWLARFTDRRIGAYVMRRGHWFWWYTRDGRLYVDGDAVQQARAFPQEGTGTAKVWRA